MIVFPSCSRTASWCASAKRFSKTCRWEYSVVRVIVSHGMPDCKSIALVSRSRLTMMKAFLYRRICRPGPGTREKCVWRDPFGFETFEVCIERWCTPGVNREMREVRILKKKKNREYKF